MVRHRFALEQLLTGLQAFNVKPLSGGDTVALPQGRRKHDPAVTGSDGLNAAQNLDLRSAGEPGAVWR